MAAGAGALLWGVGSSATSTIFLAIRAPLTLRAAGLMATARGITAFLVGGFALNCWGTIAAVAGRPRTSGKGLSGDGPDCAAMRMATQAIISSARKRRG